MVNQASFIGGSMCSNTYMQKVFCEEFHTWLDFYWLNMFSGMKSCTVIV
jgi:hypothetical protein